MIRKIALGVLLLLCICGAGCIIDGDNPDQTNPPAGVLEIVGEWEGYDTAAKLSYSLDCSRNNVAELEIEDKSTYPDIETTKRGTWEGSENTYTLKLSDGEYAFVIAENARTAELTTPDGKKVTMYRDY